MARQAITVSSKRKKKEMEGWKGEKKNSDHYDFDTITIKGLPSI